MKPREGQKRAIFSSLIWGGGEGGLGFPFILSKIVASWRGELEDLGLSERVRRVKKVKIVSRSPRRIETKM